MANSQNSQQKGKHSTTKTSKLTLVAALEILSQSFSFVEDAGGELIVNSKDGVTLFFPLCFGIAALLTIIVWYLRGRRKPAALPPASRIPQTGKGIVSQDDTTAHRLSLREVQDIKREYVRQQEDKLLLDQAAEYLRSGGNDQ